MSDLSDFSPISYLSGMTVVSVASGNELGSVLEPFIDPVNGVLLGLSVSLPDDGHAVLLHDEIHSFGRDAVMSKSDGSVVPLDEGTLPSGHPAGKLIGTKIITESGDVLGQITNIFVTLQPPPRILYEAQQSIIDKLLGRAFFFPASLGHALSDDAARLIVAGLPADLANADLADLMGRDIEVRSYDPDRAGRRTQGEDDTIVMVDEDETLVRFDDDDDTVLRQPPKLRESDR